MLVAEEEEAICSICQYPLSEKQSYMLPECNHSFHSECILNWFRHRPSADLFEEIPDGKCPNCCNRGINNLIDPIKRGNNIRRYNRKAMFSSTYFKEKRKAMQAYYKEHNGPNSLKIILDMWEKSREELKIAQNKINSYKHTIKNNDTKYNEAQKTLKNLKNTLYTKQKNVRIASNMINRFPLTTIIIPVPAQENNNTV